MKVIIYVNWEEEEVITEKEYKERLEEKKINKQDFKRYISDYLSDDIARYLKENRQPLTYATVFNLTDGERAEIMDGMRKGFKNQAEEKFSEEWEKIEIDI